MKVTYRTTPPLLVLALAISGCEYLGPQLHKKLALPQQAPISDAQFVLPDSAVAKTQTATSELFPADEKSIAVTPARARPAQPDGKGEYSLNFDDADLAEVAKVILGDILASNYMISPQVSGKVTLQTTEALSRDELIPTLEMLLGINNAALVAQGDMYLIKPSNEAVYNTAIRTLGSSNLPMGYQTAVIPLRNVAAGEIAEILKPLLPEKAQVSVDNRRNILLASGSPSELSRVVDVVNTFDVNVLKGRSFALFTPAHVDAGKLIAELDQIFNAKSGSEKEAGQSFFRFIEIERMNAILAITHNANYLRDIESWVLRLDRINSEAGGGVNVYRVQNMNAIDLANTLNNIFGMGAGARGGRPASIAAGRRAAAASNRPAAAGAGGGGFGGAGGAAGGAAFGTTDVGGGARDMAQGAGLMDRQSQTARAGGLAGTQGIGGLAGGMMGGMPGMGGMVGGGLAGTGEMANIRIIPDEGNNALVIVSSNEDYDKIYKVIKQLDVLPLQVLIDATIVEVTLTDRLEYGIRWYFSHNNGGSNDVVGGPTPTFSVRDAAAGLATGGFAYAFRSDSGDIRALLSAEAIKDNINIISSPSLMILNNQEASIKVGDSVPVRTAEAANTNAPVGGGVVLTSQIQMVDTGINLSIKPRVNAGGLVLMDILQTANEPIQTQVGGTSNIDSPTIRKREIESSVAVQSGETIVLGGLIRDSTTNNRSGVPLLHEIPLIGSLFGGNRREKDKSELVVLITPRVVNSRQDAHAITDEFRRKLSSIYVVPEEPDAPAP